MRLSLDSNILIYSIRPEDPRAAAAHWIVDRAVLVDCWLTNQALGEFLNVVRKKSLVPLDGARQTVADWSLLFPLAPTSVEQLIAASLLSERHRLQFWDAVILTVCKDVGVEYLISEDMADGATLNGVTLINPFNPANAELLDLLLTRAPGTA